MPTPKPGPQVLRRLELSAWLHDNQVSWIGKLPVADDKVIIVRDESPFGCLVQLGQFEPRITESEFLFGGRN